MKLRKKHPEIEKEIRKYLDGDLKERALEFAAWLRANGMAPQGGKIPYGGKYLCMIQIEQKQLWRLTFFMCDYSGDYDEGFTRAVQDHLQFCRACHDPCTGGMDITVFGNEYKNVCSQLTVQFENPDADTLEHIKQLLEYWKAVPDTVSWHFHNG